jgi:ribosome-associated protein
MVTNSRIKSELIAEAAANKKATGLVLLEMRGMTSFTDYFVICSGKSDRQVQAIAQGIEEILAKEGIYPLGLEGMAEGKWVLMDYEDVVVHIFLEPVRQFYDLEGLWIEAPRIESKKGETIGESSIGTKESIG